MKRVQLRPGRTVFVSSTLAEQGARAFAEAAFTRAEVEQMAALEPKHLPSVLVGASKTLQRTSRARGGARNTQTRVAAKASERFNLVR